MLSKLIKLGASGGGLLIKGTKDKISNERKEFETSWIVKLCMQDYKK